MRLRFVPAGLFLLTVAAFAQSDRGAITGTVSDPAGAVVASAGHPGQECGDRGAV
jgi:hypothetical protein